MRFSACVISVLIVSSTSAQQADPILLPKLTGDRDGLLWKPAPYFATAVALDHGTIELYQIRRYFEVEQNKAPAEVGNALPPSFQTQNPPPLIAINRRPCVEYCTSIYDPAEIQAYFASGKRIESSDIGKLLKSPRPVLISSNGRMVNQFYLQLVKEDALIFVLHTDIGAPNLSSPMPREENRNTNERPGR